MEKEQFLSLLEKYKSDTATQEEWTALREQVQKASYQDLLDLDFDQLLAVRQLHPSWTPEKESRIWEQVELRRKEQRLPVLYRWMAAAAILGAIAVAWYWFTPVKPDIYIAKAGERKTIVLPDSTVVKLNSGTTLTVSPQFNKQKREMALEGEAWFQVKHMSDKPFLVHTRDMDITDLGTEFNVRAYGVEGYTTASLVEGSIAVTPKGKGPRKSYTLMPMQKLSIGSRKHDSIAPRPILVENNVSIDSIRSYDNKLLSETAWKDDLLFIDDKTLEEVAGILARWFGVEIEVKNRSLNDKRFGGHFKATSLDKVLEMLTQVIPSLHYKKKGEKVILY